MTSKQCPQCDSSNEIVAAVCKNCGYSYFASKSVIEPEPPIAEPVTNQATADSRVRGPIPVHIVSSSENKAGLKTVWELLHVLLWCGGGLTFLVLGASLSSDFARAESAPQQAAAAAINIGYMFVAYALLRAGSEVLKTLIRS